MAANGSPAVRYGTRRKSWKSEAVEYIAPPAVIGSSRDTVTRSVLDWDPELNVEEYSHIFAIIDPKMMTGIQNLMRRIQNMAQGHRAVFTPHDIVELLRVCEVKKSEKRNSRAVTGQPENVGTITFDCFYITSDGEIRSRSYCRNNLHEYLHVVFRGSDPLTTLEIGWGKLLEHGQERTDKRPFRERLNGLSWSLATRFSNLRLFENGEYFQAYFKNNLQCWVPENLIEEVDHMEITAPNKRISIEGRLIQVLRFRAEQDALRTEAEREEYKAVSKPNKKPRVAPPRHMVEKEMKPKVEIQLTKNPGAVFETNNVFTSTPLSRGKAPSVFGSRRTYRGDPKNILTKLNEEEETTNSANKNKENIVSSSTQKKKVPELKQVTLDELAETREHYQKKATESEEDLCEKFLIPPSILNCNRCQPCKDYLEKIRKVELQFSTLKKDEFEIDGFMPVPMFINDLLVFIMNKEQRRIFLDLPPTEKDLNDVLDVFLEARDNREVFEERKEDSESGDDLQTTDEEGKENKTEKDEAPEAEAPTAPTIARAEIHPPPDLVLYGKGGRVPPHPLHGLGTPPNTNHLKIGEFKGLKEVGLKSGKTISQTSLDSQWENRKVDSGFIDDSEVESPDRSFKELGVKTKVAPKPQRPRRFNKFKSSRSDDDEESDSSDSSLVTVMRNGTGLSFKEEQLASLEGEEEERKLNEVSSTSALPHSLQEDHQEEAEKRINQIIKAGPMTDAEVEKFDKPNKTVSSTPRQKMSEIRMRREKEKESVKKIHSTPNTKEVTPKKVDVRVFLNNKRENRKLEEERKNEKKVQENKDFEENDYEDISDAEIEESEMDSQENPKPVRSRSRNEQKRAVEQKDCPGSETEESWAKVASKKKKKQKWFPGLGRK